MRKILFVLLALAGGVAHAAPITGTKTDTLVYNPLGSAPTCPAGRACSYLLAADSQVYDVDAAGLVLKSHAAKSFRASSNCSALASPANGDVCFDSTLGAFRFYSAGWASAATKTDVAAVRTYSIHGHADTAAGVKYLGPPAYGAAASTPIVLFTAPQALTVQRIVCTLGTAPGGMVADSIAVASMPTGGSWAALATSCTVTGSSTTCTGTTTSALAQYDSVGIQITRNALSVSATYDCEVAVSQ